MDDPHDLDGDNRFQNIGSHGHHYQMMHHVWGHGSTFIFQYSGPSSFPSPMLLLMMIGLTTLALLIWTIYRVRPPLHSSKEYPYQRTFSQSASREQEAYQKQELYRGYGWQEDSYASRRNRVVQHIPTQATPIYEHTNEEQPQAQYPPLQE